MKTLLAVAFLSIALQSNSFAYEQSGPCSEASAKAALKYASESWQLSEKNQIIEYSFLNPASNPAPSQTYDVGIVRQDGTFVQFDVFVNYVETKCLVQEVRFVEYAE